MKFFKKPRFSDLENSQGELKNIEPKFDKETMIGLLPGGALIIGGLLWIIRNTFYNGADSYEQSEFNVQKDLNIIKSCEETEDGFYTKKETFKKYEF